MTELKIRQVVSNFIYHTDSHGCERLLILRRSSRVRNYGNLWCVVSGSVSADSDPTALACARREIEEETGLSGETDLVLRHAGREEVVVDDPGRGVSWHVAPFLWQATRADVRIDWEHTEYKWILPEKLSSYDLVPDLERTLALVSAECQ